MALQPWLYPQPALWPWSFPPAWATLSPVSDLGGCSCPQVWCPPAREMDEPQEVAAGATASAYSEETGIVDPGVFCPLASALPPCLGDRGLSLVCSQQEGTRPPQGHLSPAPLPPQRPPMTSGSSSGTLGCPTRTMNSRPGDASGEAGERPAAGAGTPWSGADALLPLTHRQPAAHTGHHLHPSAPLPCRLLPGRPPAGRLRGWLLLLGCAAGPAPEEEVRLGRGRLGSQVSAQGDCWPRWAQNSLGTPGQP